MYMENYYISLFRKFYRKNAVEKKSAINPADCDIKVNTVFMRAVSKGFLKSFEGLYYIDLHEIDKYPNLSRKVRLNARGAGTE